MAFGSVPGRSKSAPRIVAQPGNSASSVQRWPSERRAAAVRNERNNVEVLMASID
jgi:hypothetical protein